METSNGTFILHPELADQLRGLQESSGFHTPEEFLHQLFSLEEQIRTHRLQFAALFAGVEQPWFENSPANQNPEAARSVGIQVNLCCNIRSSQKTLFKVEAATRRTSEGESADQLLGYDSDQDEEQERLEAFVDLNNRLSKEEDKPDIRSRRVIKLVDNKKTCHAGVEHHCKDCGRVFKKRHSYINHLRVHQGDNHMSLPCKLCNLSFATVWNLKLHTSAKHPEQVHKSIDKPVSTRLCHICGCEMKSQQTLKSHLRTHSADKPYKCIRCSKTFKWSSALEYHIRTHTGERPHHCHKCGKAFTNRSDLTRHRTVHTGEKPHKCTQCNKAFTQSHTLISHMKRSHQQQAETFSSVINKPDTDTTKIPQPGMILPYQTPKSAISFVQMSPAIPPAVSPPRVPNSLIQQQIQTGGDIPLERPVHDLAERDLAERELAEVMASMLQSS